MPKLTFFSEWNPNRLLNNCERVSAGSETYIHTYIDAELLKGVIASSSEGESE